MAKSNAAKCKNYCQRKALAKKKTVSKKEKWSQARKQKMIPKQESQPPMNETLCIPSTSNSQTSGPASPPVFNEGANKSTKDHITSACLSLMKKEINKKSISSMARSTNTQIIDNHQNISESQINLKTTESSQDMDVDPYLINLLKTSKVNISQVNIIIEDSDDNEEMENTTNECTPNVRKDTYSSSFKNEVVSGNTNTSLNTNDNLDNIKITDCKSLIKHEIEVSINEVEVVHNNRNSNTSNMEYTNQQLDDNVQEIDDNVQEIDDNVQEIDDNVQEIDDSSSTSSAKSSNLVIDIDSDDPSLSKLNQNSAVALTQSNLSQNKTNDQSQSNQNHNYVHYPSQTNSILERLLLRGSSSPVREIIKQRIKKRLRSAKAKDKDKDSNKCSKVRKLSTSEESTQDNELLVPRTKPRPKAVCHNKWGVAKSLKWLESSIGQLMNTSLKVHEEPSSSHTTSVSEQFKKRQSLLAQKVEMMNQRLPNETDLEQWKRMKDLAFDVYGVPKRPHATNETSGDALVQKKAHCEKQIHTPDILLPSWVKPNKITIKPILNNQEKMNCQNDKIRTETVKSKLVDYKMQTDQLIMGCMDQQLDILCELNKTTSSTNGDLENIKPTLNKLIKIQSSMNRAHETLSMLSEINDTVGYHPILSQPNSSEQISETPNASALRIFDQILGNSTQFKRTPTLSEQFISSQNGKIHINPLGTTQFEPTQTNSVFISSQNGEIHIKPLGTTQSVPTQTDSEQFISSQSSEIYINPPSIIQNINSSQSSLIQCGSVQVNLPFTITSHLLSLHTSSKRPNPSQSASVQSHQVLSAHHPQTETPESLITQTDLNQSIEDDKSIAHKNSEVDPLIDQNQVQISDGVGTSENSATSLLQGVKLSEVPRWTRTLMPLLLGQCRRAERLSRGARKKASESLDQNLPMVVMTQTPEGKPLLVSGLCSPHAISALAAAFAPCPSTSAASTTCIGQRLASQKRRSTHNSCRVRIDRKQRRIHNSKQNKMIQRTARYRGLKKKNKMKILDQRRNNEEDQNKESTEAEMCHENVDQSNMLHDQNDFGSANASLSNSSLSRCSSLMNINQENTVHSSSEHQQGCDQGQNSSTHEDGAINTNLNKIVGDESNQSSESVT